MAPRAIADHPRGLHWPKPQAVGSASDQPYIELHHRLGFRIFVAALILAALSFYGYVQYQERANHTFLQIGGSLRPVVNDYFSWSVEAPLQAGDQPIVGEYYSYKRPSPDYSKMSVWEKASVWVYETASGGREATKQCHAVTKDGTGWDTGSDDKVVPTAAITGHVLTMYDSRYKQLSQTTEGQFRLRLERHSLKDSYKWAPNESFVAINASDGSTIYQPNGRIVRVFKGWIADVWRDTNLILFRPVSPITSAFILYDPTTGAVTANVDTEGRPIAPLNMVTKSDGLVVHGRLGLLFDNDTKSRWLVEVSGPSRQVSTITFDKAFTGTLDAGGGGDADVFVKIWADGKPLAEKFGVWSIDKMELRSVKELKVEIARFVTNGRSSGGIDRFTLTASK